MKCILGVWGNNRGKPHYFCSNKTKAAVKIFFKILITQVHYLFSSPQWRSLFSYITINYVTCFPFHTGKTNKESTAAILATPGRDIRPIKRKTTNSSLHRLHFYLWGRHSVCVCARACVCTCTTTTTVISYTISETDTERHDSPISSNQQFSYSCHITILMQHIKSG